MSFGLSSGGGQVRYAVVFDSTQAEQNVRRYQTSLQQLATGTTGVSGKMAIMNNTFTAGVTPIKNTGNALNQLSTTQKTIGSQLGGLGSAFKSNALAIGAAASSVLGLYQNYANLSSAQNAANKSATAAKAAQVNLKTATDNLQKAIDKYGSGSKEAQKAQEKLTVAQERAVNKTESAKIAQDNLNQTMADFGINILPNVLLAGGSVTSIFDNIGKSGKGLGGVIGKVSGAFGGLGGATGLLKGGMTGLLTTLGPLALALGGIAAALLYAKDTADVAAKAMDEFKAAAKLEDVTKSIQGMNTALDKLKLTPGIGSLKQIGDLIASLGAGGLRNNFVDMAKNMAASARLAASDIGKLAEAQKKLDADSATLASKQKERQTTSVKAEVEHMKAVVADDKAEVARLKTIIESNTLKSKSIILTQDELNIISRRNEAMATARDQDIADAAAIGEVIKVTTAAADGAKRMAEELKLENDAMKNILPNIVKLGENSAKSAEATKLVGDMVKLTKDRMVEWNSVIDPVASALKDLTKITIDATAATVAGIEKFGSFIKTTAEGAITNKVYHDSLLATVGAQVQLPPALDLTTSQLESVQTALDNAKVGLTENANAAGILADALDQQLAPSIQKLGGALTALNDKEFKKAFKELKFGDVGKKFKEFASDLDRSISQINEESGRMETIFSQLSVALSINKLPHKQWVAGLEGMRKEIEKIGHIQKIDLSGITAFIAKAESIKDPVQLAKYQKVIALITEKSKGGFNSTELVEIATAIEQTGESSGKAAPKLDAAQQALVKFGREASSTVTITAQMSASMVTSVGTAVDFITKTLGGIASIQVPTPNEKNYQKGLQLAINNAAQTVKFIKKELDKISGIKVPAPNEKTYQKGLQLAINNAAQTVKLIGKELGKIGSIKVPAPKFNNFNSALDQAVSDAKRAVRDINNALTKVKKPSSGGGNGSGPGATTGPFNSDSSIQGSKADSGGGGGGDTIINIHVMDETIMRRITARSGRGRFTMGA